MLRRDLIRALASMPFVGWFRPWKSLALGADARQELDAAAIYPRAFAWAKDQRSEDRDLLRRAPTTPLDNGHIEELIRQARPALEAIREAAGVGGCRWEAETLTVEQLNRGHIDGANTNVVRVACLSARRHARAGRGREALDDLFAGLTMAHRIGTDGVLIARVLEAAGEFVAFETMGRILLELDRGNRDDLSRRLDALPPPQPASATIAPESRFILSTFRAKIMTLGPVLGDEAWAELGADGADPARTEALRRLTGGDRARLLAHLDATGPAYDELARRLDLPWRQCGAALDEFARTERSAQPVVTGLVESAKSHRMVVERQRIIRAMTRAGLVLVDSGEPAFRAISDPSRSGPFELERQGEGYLIRSPKDDLGRLEVTLVIPG